MMIQRRSRRTPVVQIVSMIDVMFFLVTFLMLFATFEPSPDGISVDLPRAASAQEQPATELVITITSDGVFYVNDRHVTVQGLKDIVRQTVASSSQVVAVIRADKNAVWDSVVMAMDAVSEAGGSSISFSAERPIP